LGEFSFLSSLCIWLSVLCLLSSWQIFSPTQWVVSSHKKPLNKYSFFFFSIWSLYGKSGLQSKTWGLKVQTSNLEGCVVHVHRTEWPLKTELLWLAAKAMGASVL
jgi:hypothetical protein